MKFLKYAVCVLFTLALANLGLTGYVYNESQKPVHLDIKVPAVPLSPVLMQMLDKSKIRDSHIMQAILVSHHNDGIHPPGQHPMCPLCNMIKEALPQIKTAQR
jgi:hypothetical protein